MEDDSNEPSPKKEVECTLDEDPLIINEDLDKNASSSGSEVYEEDISGNELELKKSLFDSNLNIKLPRMNVREKIIICLDLCADNDNDSTPFRFGDGTKQTPLAMLKRVIQMYLYCKMTIDTKHQYALMVLHDTGVTWLVDFTVDPVAITNTLSTLKSRDQPPECDLGQMFDMVADKVVLPHVNDPITELPSHVVRVIFLYARTNCRPTVQASIGAAKALLESPVFFLDLIYVHEPLNEEVKDTCQSIFNSLCSELSLPCSYVFNVGRNPTKLHDSMAKLLAHPLQRPRQQDAEYKLLMPE